MAHVIEHASSGRAKCHGCDTRIDKGELRFGERRPNAFGEGEMTLWFHLPCAAYKRINRVEPHFCASTREMAPITLGECPANRDTFFRTSRSM